MQPAYRSFHSTETALLQNDLFKPIGQKNLVAFVLLDLSVAFDTIDQHVLLSRSAGFGIQALFQMA